MIEGSAAPSGLPEEYKVKLRETITRLREEGFPEPSPDQQLALQQLLYRFLVEKCREATLVGGAGTGKTFLMRLFAALMASVGRPCLFAAPTGKAAARLRESVGRNTTTVHSLIYGAPVEYGRCPHCGEWCSRIVDLEKHDAAVQEAHTLWQALHGPSATPDAGSAHEARLKLVAYGADADSTSPPVDGDIGVPCSKCGHPVKSSDVTKTRLDFVEPARDDGTVEWAGVIVDEASMVDDKVYADFLRWLPPGRFVLWVGDNGQLEPVEGTWGPDLLNPTAALTQVHRQAEGNPILDGAYKVRNHATYPWRGYPNNDPRFAVHLTRRQGGLKLWDPAKWLADHRRAESSATLLCYSNKLRFKLNQAVHYALGYHVDGEPGVINDGPRFPLYQPEGPPRPILPGMHVVLLHNVKHFPRGDGTIGVMNGEVFQVTEAEWTEAPRSVDLPDWTLLRLRLRGVEGDVYAMPHVLGKGYAEFNMAKRPFRGMQHRLELGYKRQCKLHEVEPTQKGLEAYIEVARAFPLYRLLHFDYGEAITGHKSQGSQWDHVGVVWDGVVWWRYREDRGGWRRWMYTAMTRAQQTLTMWVS